MPAGVAVREHPCLLVTKQEIAGIKEKAARHPWAKAAYEKLFAGADAWLKRKVELPNRGGQWWHWYACPKCGTRLKTLGPTRHECPTCKKVYSGEPYDTVVISRDHSDLARATEDLGLAYQLTGDARYAAKAAEILEAYAERYVSYPRHTIRGEDKVGGGRVGPQTLDESTWLIPVVHGYDLIWDALTPQQREKIETKLLRPAAELILEHKMGIHNIQCWKNSAVGLVGLCINEPRFIADAVESAHGIRQQLAKGILDDGFWFEGAWGYHYYTMSALVPLAEAARHTGIEVYDDRYKRFYEAPLLFALPNGKLPAFNDSAEADAYAAWPRYELAFARWREPRLAALLKGKERTTRESLLYGVPELPAEAALPSGSRNFPASGLAYLQCDEGRDAPVALLDYGPHGGGHGHPDKLQLVLYASGEIIAPDPGCIAYGVPLHGEWYRQTISHNTVTVDGKSQKPCQGKLLFFCATPELAVASASADDAYDGVRFTRTVAVLPGGIVVDLVGLASDKSHVYDWAFHCYGNLTTPLPLNPAFEPPGKTNGYQHLRNLTGCVARDWPEAGWKSSATEVHLRMEERSGSRVYSGEGYGQPSSRPLPTLLVRKEGKDAQFVSAFRVGKKDSKPPQLSLDNADPPGVTIGVGWEDQYAHLDLPPIPGKGLTNPHDPMIPELMFRSDGRADVVRVSSRKLKGAAFVEGTSLKAGNFSIAASQKATVSLTYQPGGESLVVVQTHGEATVSISRLFPERSVVKSSDGAPVAATWREGTLSFAAKPGRHIVSTPGKPTSP